MKQIKLLGDPVLRLLPSFQHLHPMANQKFKITNWSTYNKALKQHGSLTIWLDESAIAAWTEKTTPERRGRPLHYSDMAYHQCSNDEVRVWPFSKGFTGLR